MINAQNQQQFFSNQNQYYNQVMFNQQVASKTSPPASSSQHGPQTPVKNLFIESTASKLMMVQSPLQLNSFKLGSIPHQSSPYTSLATSKSVQIAKSECCYDNDEECDDYEKPKVFQDEDCVVTSAAVATLATITSKCDSLNISSPSLSNSQNAGESSFLSSQTKSSLKTSASSASAASSNKHVKFCTEKTKSIAIVTSASSKPPPETPIMFSRSSSMTSLNSFDAKSIHSSVASEYSRRPSGIMSPSELPDSPDESYVMSLRQQQQQMNFYSNNRDSMSKSNEITMIERTIMNKGTSSNSSEKNSFFNSNPDDDDNDIPFLKDNTIAYDVEGSPWRHGLHSEVSSLSALTFNDDASEHRAHSNKDLAAILSLLQTRSKESKAAAAAGGTATQPQNYQQMTNFNVLNFTPPIKLPATTASKTSNQPEYCFYSNSQLSMPQATSLPLSVDIPKLYCDEYTPSNISPQSTMSELSVPSLIKQEISLPTQALLQKSQYDALIKRLNFNQIPAMSNKNENLEVIDLEVPKVYETEDGSINHPKKQPRGAFSSSASHFLPQQNSVDTDSPKLFLTEDTPMCYSGSSSLNSLNDDTSVNRTTINKSMNNAANCTVINKTSNEADDDDLNKSSLLLSDSCHKPTNTPANPVNMSRGSYSSPNESGDDEEDDDEDKENKIEHRGDDNDDEEEDDSKKEDIIIKQFINQTMPVTKLKATSQNVKATKNSHHSNADDDDEMLLQNFIKEMLPPVPTRKSTSKLPVFNKRLSVNETEKKYSETPTKATVQKISKKRLSEENPGVHSHKIQQHNRNFSFCYNLATAAAAQQQQQHNQLPPQSPKLNKKPPALTLSKTTSQLTSTNLNKTTSVARRLGSGVGITQTASTYSLSTITTTSSSSNSITTAGQHHHHAPHHAPPVVNMTRTTQLRASKLAAENKSTAVRKPQPQPPTTTTQRQAATTKTTVQSQIKQKPLNTNNNIPQIESGTRRKSFHGALTTTTSTSSIKKTATAPPPPSTTAATRCTNENQIAKQQQQAVKLQTNAESSTAATKNVLKKTNLNKLNK